MFVCGLVDFFPALTYLLCLALPGSCTTRSASFYFRLCSANQLQNADRSEGVTIFVDIIIHSLSWACLLERVHRDISNIDCGNQLRSLSLSDGGKVLLL